MYNCETWDLGEVEKKELRHTHYKLARQAMGEFYIPKKKPGEEPTEAEEEEGGQTEEEEKNETREEFLKRHNLASTDDIMACRKAVWLGHAKRNKDEMMLEAFEQDKNNNASWWTTLVAELDKYDVTPDWVFDNADHREMIRMKFRNAADPTVVRTAD